MWSVRDFRFTRLRTQRTDDLIGCVLNGAFILFREGTLKCLAQRILRVTRDQICQ